MSTVSNWPSDDGPRFRLFQPAEEGVDGPAGLSPEMTLAQFFAEWFLPVVLVGNGRSAGTVTIYRDMLRWWELLTGDPPVRLIDEFVVSRFAQGLRSATYRRGRLGAVKPLSADTRSKYERSLRALLNRVGRTRHPARPGKGLVDETPYVPITPGSREPKRPFPLDVARSLWRACEAMREPLACGSPAAWWRAAVALMFYTGFRSGTVLGLEWSMLEDRDGQLWLIVPTRLVPKTHKPIARALHPLARSSVETLRPLVSGPLILPFPHCYEHFAKRLHAELQTRAEVPPARQMSPQAWRRTHTVELARTGFHAARRLAQWSLDHEDASTTEEHYGDLRNEFILQMPRLDAGPQRLLF